MSNAIGLDLGSRAIKAVHLNKAKEGYALAYAAHREIPFVDEDVPRDEIRADALKQFIREGGVKSKEVTVSLSGEYTQIRPAEMPRMTEDELRHVLPIEIEQYIATNPEESVVDFQILGDAKNDNTKMNVLVVAGRLEASETIYNAMMLVKLKCTAVDVDDLALANMFDVNYAWEEDYKKTVALLNVGNRLTSLLIFDEGVLRFVRPITVAGETLTKDIQREFALKAEQAEDLKREQGKIVIEDASSFSLTMFDRDDRTLRIYETISTSLTKMLAEIKRCFDYYDTQYKGKSVERILLSGGGSRLRNIEKYLSDKLGVPVDFADPFRQIRVPTKGALGQLVEAYSASFSVGVGLALRRFV